MPTLDVSEAFDPSFMDDIIVLRQSEVINSSGRGVQTEKRISTQAVITAVSPDDLNRLPEGQYMNKAISIYTQFRLQGPSPGFQADEVLWPPGKNGSKFVVVALDDFSRYGRGFIKAVAVSVNAVDPPPQGI